MRVCICDILVVILVASPNLQGVVLQAILGSDDHFRGTLFRAQGHPLAQVVHAHSETRSRKHEKQTL